MATSTVHSQTPKPITTRQIVGGVIGLVGLLSIPFIAAGHLDWWPGLIYLGLFLIAAVGSRLIVLRTNPDLLAERARGNQGEGGKRWDKVLAPLVGLYGPFTIWIVAGLDERFNWSQPDSPVLIIGGLVVVALGSALATWAMYVNKFFSALVRIQTERGHTVVTSGPYRLVRHPGYLGGLLDYLATPFALNSLWAIVPAVLTVVALIIRTALEDRTLRAELPGYKEYAQRVRYRLLPRVW